QMITYTGVVLVFLVFMVALVGLADLGLAKLVLQVFG
ncbi:MAG: preprotein translocase subunit SecE, partial [Mycobacterium sp.]